MRPWTNNKVCGVARGDVVKIRCWTKHLVRSSRSCHYGVRWYCCCVPFLQKGSHVPATSLSVSLTHPLVHVALQGSMEGFREGFGGAGETEVMMLVLVVHT
jgi:hypothetical protein